MQAELKAFREFGKRTRVESLPWAEGRLQAYVNEYWTSRQRAAHSLHEISYRACFKPQLARFFIERLTTPGQRVYDPFMGRGTTLLEAALMGRLASGCDVNPLSPLLLAPRLDPPSLEAIAARLEELDLRRPETAPEELLVFYHRETLNEIASLRRQLTDSPVDRWIRMVALNRLTGHSPGFFSVYTLPPNQAVSLKSQLKINQRRNQTPAYRDTRALILKKSRTLLRDPLPQELRQSRPDLLIGDCRHTPALRSQSVDLVVTSPPFLDVVDYGQDNWLRCWFAGIDPQTVPLTVVRRLEDWQEAMAGVFSELARVVKKGGHVAFEVGEVRAGQLELERAVVPCADPRDWEPLLVLIQDQRFTKTARCWGVHNGSKGTNTNRVVLLRRKGPSRRG